MFLQFVSRLATAKKNALGNLCLTEAISSFSANPVFRNRFNWLRIIFLDGVAIVRLLSRVWSDGRDTGTGWLRDPASYRRFMLRLIPLGRWRCKTICRSVARFLPTGIISLTGR